MSQEKKMRTVLSFDVGIINLAYCMLEIDDDNKLFSIKKWDIINLTNGRYTCEHYAKNKKVCGKIANRIMKIDEYNKQYFCTAHISDASLDVRQVNVKLDKIEPDKQQKCEMCNKTGEYTLDNFTGQYCKTHQKSLITKNKLICCTKKCTNIVKKGVYLKQSIENTESYSFGWCDEHSDKEYQEYIQKKSKKISQNSNKISQLSLGQSMYKELDKIPELLTVDEVLVENQPTHINPTMKTVSVMLFSYFIMRGMTDRLNTKSKISDISFFSPSNKIKVGGKEANTTVENASDNKTYKVTKKLGIQLCKALINDKPEYLNMIESHKKQDDMADAFLQGFIMIFGPVLPTHYENKIKTVHIDENDNDNIKDEVDINNDENVIKTGKKTELTQQTKKFFMRRKFIKKNN